MTTATRRRARRLNLNTVALTTALALGIGAFIGAVACTIQLIARI